MEHGGGARAYGEEVRDLKARSCGGMASWQWWAEGQAQRPRATVGSLPNEHRLSPVRPPKSPQAHQGNEALAVAVDAGE